VIPGTGTLLNTGTVLVGGALGLTIGRFLPAALLRTIRVAIGLFTVVIGLQMALKTRNPLILLVSLLLGVLIGELLRLEEAVQAVGRWAQGRLDQGGAAGRVSTAFITTSLLFCVGPLTVLGTFQDGTAGVINLLAVKSTLDGFSSIVFANALGAGVLLSAATVLVVQGALTVAAYLLHAGLGSAQTAELTAVGGVAVIALALGLLELKTVRVASFLPGLLVAPALVSLLQAVRMI
jgi:uncharacterized membrane protein YqgA involved in biofilm formation